MRKQKPTFKVLEDVKLNFLQLQKIRGGGPEGEPTDEDSWSNPGKP